MSISSMANVAFVRRADVDVPEVAPLNQAPATADKIALAKAGTVESKSAVTTALEVIATYIPTEVLTLYVAVLAAIQAPKQMPTPPNQSPPVTGQALASVASQQPFLRGYWIAFYSFLVATPIVVWLVYAAKVRTAGKPLPAAPRTWPVWEMCAATIAYVAWAFALPDSPFKYSFDWYSSALAGVFVLIISTLLGLLAPLFQRPLSA